MAANRNWLATISLGMTAAMAVAQAPPSLFGSRPTAAPAPAPMMTGPSVSSLPSVSGAMAGMTDGLTDGTPVTTALTQQGVVNSPWTGASVGANGGVTYEGYIRTGPSLLNGGEFSHLVNTGVTVQGGARTLFFDQSHDAAWAFDLGLGYTYNPGNRLNSTVDVTASQLRFGTPDQNFTIPLGVRSMTRWGLNYAVGRDWFLNGPGFLGHELGGNSRVGFDVGGRYGTANVGFEPQADPNGYRRRHGNYQAAFIGAHFNWERPMGAYILQFGTRVEWGYNWTNLIPPADGDFNDLNILFSLGIRY